jgi:hypothetical protein
MGAGCFLAERGHGHASVLCIDWPYAQLANSKSALCQQGTFALPPTILGGGLYAGLCDSAAANWKVGHHYQHAEHLQDLGKRSSVYPRMKLYVAKDVIWWPFGHL